MREKLVAADKSFLGCRWRQWTHSKCKDYSWYVWYAHTMIGHRVNQAYIKQARLSKNRRLLVLDAMVIAASRQITLDVDQITINPVVGVGPPAATEPQREVVHHNA